MRYIVSILGLISVLSTAGCAGDLESPGRAREAVIVNPNEVQISTLSTGTLGAYASGSGVTAQFDLRPMGIPLEPSGLVAVAAPNVGFVCTGFPAWFCRNAERISAYVLDIDAASSTTNPTVASSHANAWLGNTVSSGGNLTGIRGMAATGFRDGSGNVDGLFLFTASGSPATIRAFTLEGEASSPSPSSVVTVGGTSSLLDYRAVPAVSHGTWSSTSKIFMAYVAPTTSGGVPQIRAGFLTRTGSAWSFTQTAQIAATSGVTGGVYHALVAAYDANNHEFTVGWQFNEYTHPDGRAWTAYLQRFNWSGLAVGSRFEAHVGVDSSHSGAQLSFNRDTGRYHFLFQHNSALVERTSSGLSCARSGLSCIDSQTCVSRGSRTTTEVDYFGGFEFRMGGQCSGSSSCTGGAGVVSEMAIGSAPTVTCSASSGTDRWTHERFGSAGNELWLTSVYPGSGELVDIVRAPLVQRSVALIVRTPNASTGVWPSLSFRVIDETSRPFDE